MFFILTGFPLGLENLENGKAFFQLGESHRIFNRLKKSQGKSHKNTGQVRTFQTNVIYYF